MAPNPKTYLWSDFRRPRATGPAEPITLRGNVWNILRSSRILLLATALLAVVACTQTVTGPAPASPTASSATTDAEARPNLISSDPGRSPSKCLYHHHQRIAGGHCLRHLDGGFLRLSEADDRGIERLHDSIKLVYEPRYDPAQGGD